MDAQPSSSDDMNDLESRLAGWRPSTTGLDSDGVLFAAGRASVRPGWGRIAWPVVSVCFALLAATLGVQLSQERSARLELVGRLRDPKRPIASGPSFVPEPVETPLTEPPSADSYLAARRALASNPDSWLAATTKPAEGPLSSDRLIWKAGSHTDMLLP